jgi:hypothetical protein
MNNISGIINQIDIQMDEEDEEVKIDDAIPTVSVQSQ